jgi:hypothetical protein
MRRLIAFALLSMPALVQAAEGMWTFDRLPIEQMQARYGFSPDHAWAEHVMRGSVRLAGGCSGSFASPDGLVLTNAHCVLACVSQLASGHEDLVAAGFVARDRSQERRCPDVELDRLEQISDVSERVQDATKGHSGRSYIQRRNAITAAIASECGDDERTRCDVVELYDGGLYHLYRYHRFHDVRLVFSPEYAIGFFGGDPDNFNFPRYTFDVGILRAYEDDRPAKIVDYFPLSTRGVKPGDLTLVTGSPGATDRQLTVAQLERLRDYDLLDELLVMAERRGLLYRFSQESAERARVAQRDLTVLENRYKVFGGRLRALIEPALLAQKRRDEEALMAAASPEQRQAWADIAQAGQRWRAIRQPYAYIERQRAFWSRYYGFARTLVRAAEERAKPSAERLPEFQDAALPRVQQTLLAAQPLDGDLEAAKLSSSLTKLREVFGPDDEFVKLVLGRQSPEALAGDMVRGTTLGEVAARRALWDGGAKAIAESTDPFIQLARATDGPARAIRAQYESEVEAVEDKALASIAALRFAHNGTRSYPDATFTLRLSYGEVRGWVENGREVEPFTVLGGLFARATGYEPFRLPQRWLDHQAALDPQTPFNFVTTNDIVGGNSGSPVLNRDAEIVGLAFDGNSHSLGGAYGFDERLNRSIAVDSRGIRAALRNVYQASNLVQELKLQ